MKAKPEKYEVIIPERSFIVNNLKEAKEILDKHKFRGIIIKRIKEAEPTHQRFKAIYGRVLGDEK